MNLSPNFTLEELTFSDNGSRAGLKNNPNDEQIANLKRLAALLEDVRKILQNPMHINSGYRSPEINKLAGGSEVPPSAHMRGRAADFICRKFGNPKQICEAIIASGIEFDKLIYEYASWVHIQIPELGEKPKKEVYTKKAGVAGYLKGIVV